MQVFVYDKDTDTTTAISIEENIDKSEELEFFL